MHFWAIFTQKNARKSVENYYFLKKFKLVLKTTYKKLVLKYQGNARFPSLCLASENAFLTYIFTQKIHNSVENDRTGKKFTLVLKTTY